MNETKKMYWNIPNVQVINSENIYKIYNDFIIHIEERNFEELSDLCTYYFNKENNNKYFGHILTIINLLGLLQVKDDTTLTVERNEFLFDNMDKLDFINNYLEYSLSYFQYPRYNLTEDRNIEIRKPYLLILELLKYLYLEDKNKAYLTRTEFYNLFNSKQKPYITHKDINVQLAKRLIEERELIVAQDNLRVMAYDLAYLKNSSLLTFDSFDYSVNEDFAFGLSKDYGVLEKVDFLLSEEIKNDICEFDIYSSIKDKREARKWALFLNNKSRFSKWLENVHNDKEKEEVGAGGNVVGIEWDEDIEGIDEFKVPFDPGAISIESRTVALDTVLRRLQNKTIRLAPPFQRKSVWDKERKSKLIESMMLKIPLPMFYISSDKSDNWDVVDGLQRLTTIQEFILGNYDKDKEKFDGKGFKLSNLEFWSKLNGETYESLPGKIFNNIAETELRFTIINPNTPEEVKRNIFKRINTGGMPLTSQEIRHALYQGISTKLLEKLVSNKYFILAVNDIDDSRMAARELILRFLSFYLRGYQSYTTSNMDKFISDTMRVINHIEDISINKLQQEFPLESENFVHNVFLKSKNKNVSKIEDDFEIAMNRSYTLFEEHTFRKSFPGKRKTPINKTLFEVFGNLLLELSHLEYKNLLANKKHFLNTYKKKFLLDLDFANMIGRDSHKVSSIKERYECLRYFIKDFIK